MNDGADDGLVTPLRASTLHGDGPCDDCGGDNIVWFTLNVIWNEVMKDARVRGRNIDEKFGSETPSILCIRCFVWRAEERGLDPTSWLLLPNWAGKGQL